MHPPSRHPPFMAPAAPTIPLALPGLLAARAASPLAVPRPKPSRKPRHAGRPEQPLLPLPVTSCPVPSHDRPAAAQLSVSKVQP